MGTFIRYKAISLTAFSYLPGMPLFSGSPYPMPRDIQV
jgi:hypothetical protein